MLRPAPAFHPPDAILYLQLAPRRRVVSALLVGSGLALGAASLAYGAVTRASWAMAVALASAFVGAAAAFAYQSRVRPAQLAEDRARAMALYDGFDGRLEFGRLALTQAGVEQDGETFSWASIHTIDSTFADARAKRATLRLDAAHENRRIGLSFAGLTETPAVVYALMKMLWMRQITPRNVEQFLPRMRVQPHALLPKASTAGTVWTAVGIVAMLAGIFAGVKLVAIAQPSWAALPPVAGIALFMWALSRSSRANWRETSRQQDRAIELESSRPMSDDFEFRRRRATRWPSIITVIFLAPAALFFVSGDWPLAQGFLVFAAVVSSIAWTIAWLLGAGVIATLTPTGIVLRGREIPWADIASLDLQILPRIETGQLVLRLTRARSPRTLRERIDSSLSGGHSDREIVVSLARSKEPAEVVLRLAQSRWERAIGSRRAEAALYREVGETMRATRTWGQLSTEEKAKKLWIGAAMFLFCGFSVHGALASFRMADSWLIGSLVLSVVLAVWCAVALLRGRHFVSARAEQGTPSYIALFLIMSLFFGAVSWSTIGHSWPDLVTRWFGRGITRDVTYDKSGYRDSKKCPYPLALHLDAGRPYRFCIAGAAYASLPAAGRLRLQLRESWFGVHIVRVSTPED